VWTPGGIKFVGQAASWANGLSLGQFQELTLIHELLHATGLVGNDTNPDQRITLPNGQTVTGSAGVSKAIRQDCFD